MRIDRALGVAAMIAATGWAVGMARAAANPLEEVTALPGWGADGRLASLVATLEGQDPESAPEGYDELRELVAAMLRGTDGVVVYP